MDEGKEKILSDISNYLDISPTDFQRAKERYNGVSNWLKNGSYQSGTEVETYLQGSFRLGTIVRPYIKGADAEFDIDQVCELKKRSENSDAQDLKLDIGKRLNEHLHYRSLLDKEGKRCWTLNYNTEEGRPGFHLDVLPAFCETNGREGEIKITNKEILRYTWSPSNPKGYYYWFKSKNGFSEEFIMQQRGQIYESNRSLYSNVEEVPKQLIRSTLQRSIQLMKRHRDVYFSDLDYKPISIIITTICSHVYIGEGIIRTIKRFTNYVIERHNSFIGNILQRVDGILDFNDGEWSIPNPVHYGKSEDEIENFADKWNKDKNFALAFFKWVYQLDRDIRGFEISGASSDLYLGVKSFNDREKYPEVQIKKLSDRNLMHDKVYTNKLLDLIHLGIENKINWSVISKIAAENVEYYGEGTDKDVARINYYQTIKHQGINLSIHQRNEIQEILDRHPIDKSFILCGNLLLGRATRLMLKECISERREDSRVMEWPIIRLASPELFLPS